VRRGKSAILPERAQAEAAPRQAVYLDIEQAIALQETARKGVMLGET
jgi:hypothetical protein